MYIMSNNNPEELYLQDLRIDEEESFLGKDIKRQQKEIDALIDEKRKEAKMTAKDKKNEEQKDNENIDKMKLTTCLVEVNENTDKMKLTAGLAEPRRQIE